MKPREKLIKNGVDNLSNKELFALLVGSGQKDRGLREISSELDRITKGLVESEDVLTLEDLEQVRGIGVAKASNIIAGIEIGRRFYDKSYKTRTILTTSKDAVALFKDISSREKEYLDVAFINARYELLARETLAIGTLDQVGLHPREILVRALSLNSFGIIIAHNHPSGDPSPSRSDIAATKNLKKACDLIGIKLIDHLILTEGDWRSVKF